MNICRFFSNINTHILLFSLILLICFFLFENYYKTSGLFINKIKIEHFQVSGTVDDPSTPPPSPAGYTCTSWSPTNDKQGTNIMQENSPSSIQQNLNDCANVCNETIECEGYSYGPQRRACFLKKDISSFTVNDRKPPSENGEDFAFCQVNVRPTTTLAL